MCLRSHLLRRQQLPQARVWQGLAQRQCRAVSALTCSPFVLPAAMVLMAVVLPVSQDGAERSPARPGLPCAGVGGAPPPPLPEGPPGQGARQGVPPDGDRAEERPTGLVRTKLGRANLPSFCGQKQLLGSAAGRRSRQRRAPGCLGPGFRCTLLRACGEGAEQPS